ncbi:MAG: hypothetical protein KC912_24340 [Proteobacteria bacterium]|nr:hypothetical protein [Pseudomonadota bacterium]
MSVYAFTDSGVLELPNRGMTRDEEARLVLLLRKAVAEDAGSAEGSVPAALRKLVGAAPGGQSV